MKRVIAIGECMVELRREGEDLYRRGFAGDVFNMAVYLKRAAGQAVDVQFMTAIGADDPVSDEMASFWRSEGIGTDRVIRVHGATPGVYLVETDSHGERRFTYWRSASPARSMIRAAERRGGLSFEGADLIVYSGITLAILDRESRAALFAATARARRAGATVAFDPNYRPSLWSGEAEAASAINHAYEHCDIALPGVDDERALFGKATTHSIIARLRGLGVREIAVKAGRQGASGWRDEAEWTTPFAPAARTVDTTAAGDAFDGTYLGRRLVGDAPLEAARRASAAAAIVVGFKGAIAPREAFEESLHEQEAL